MFRIIDVHGHASKFWLPMPWKNSDIIAYLERFGIEKFVASSLLAICEDLIEGNKETLEFIREYPGIVYGYVVVNPHYMKTSLKEIGRYSKIEGFVGIKIHDGYYMRIDPLMSPVWKRVWQMVSDLGWAVLSHNSLASLAKISQEYPDANFISAHATNSMSTVKYVLKGCSSNLFLDVCGTPRNYGVLETLVKVLGSADNIVFGTDLPLISPSSSLGKIENAEIPREEKEKILYKNALKIFTF